MTAIFVILAALIAAIAGGVIAALIVIDSLRRANTPQSGVYGHEQREPREPRGQRGQRGPRARRAMPPRAAT